MSLTNYFKATILLITMKEFALNQTYYKVLSTIAELNKQSYYPLNEGIYKILAGIFDEEVSSFSELPTFGTLTSFSSKKICHLTLMLFRHGYVGKIFDANTKKLYFRVTEKGKEALNMYAIKHKRAFARHKAKSTPTIVKIEG